MAGIITPLSRRPRWLLLPLILLGLFLFILVFSTASSAEPFPPAGWLFPLYLLGFIGLWYQRYTTLTITDYDADYLYIFQKTGTQQIPLGSFYKLVESRGWRLHYLDEKRQKQTLGIIALSPGWLWQERNSSIHGFIDAVWQHNPDLDVEYSWLG